MARRRRLLAIILSLPLAAFGASALSPPAAAETRPPEGIDECDDLSARPTVEEARACRLAAEREIGPDATAMIGLYAHLATLLAQDPDAALYALPYRRRALDLARASYGAERIETADAALAYAQSLILSGRCMPNDPMIEPLLDEAAVGYGALDPAHAAREEGLAAVARAYADGHWYASAARTLGAQSALGPEDWLRVADWSRRDGDAEAAREAYEQALGLASAAVAKAATPAESNEARHVHARVTQRLRALLFQLGDFDRLRALRDAGESDGRR